jgi:hypothetical protein
MVTDNCCGDGGGNACGRGDRDYEERVVSVGLSFLMAICSSCMELA